MWESFVIVIEAAEHETFFRQPTFLATETLQTNFLASIVGLIAIWQVNHFFRVKILVALGDHMPIRNYIINIASA